MTACKQTNHDLFDDVVFAANHASHVHLQTLNDLASLSHRFSVHEIAHAPSVSHEKNRANGKLRISQTADSVYSNLITAEISSSPRPRTSAALRQSRTAARRGSFAPSGSPAASRISLCMCFTENCGEKSPERSFGSFSFVTPEYDAVFSKALK